VRAGSGSATGADDRATSGSLPDADEESMVTRAVAAALEAPDRAGSAVRVGVRTGALDLEVDSGCGVRRSSTRIASEKRSTDRAVASRSRRLAQCPSR
jgi:hypothetical protein